MKIPIKKLISLLGIFIVAIFVFYAGKLSLRVDEDFAGKEYNILLNGNEYTGIVDENGMVYFPWNPFRKGGLATIEIYKNKDRFASIHHFKPSYGRHVIFPKTSNWATGHVTYIFGISIRENRRGRLLLHKTEQNRVARGIEPPAPTPPAIRVRSTAVPKKQ